MPRSRRTPIPTLRCRGCWIRDSRRARGIHKPSSIIQCRSVSTETCIPCSSVSFSCANVGPKSSYCERTMASASRSNSEDSRRLLGLPRCFDARPIGPSRSYDRRSRRTWRLVKPNIRAASSCVSRFSITRSITLTRSSSS